MLQIRARVESEPTAPSAHQLRVTLATNEREQHLRVEPRPDGRGLATNGAELLCAALATCFCNDVYREAASRGITVERVEVEVCSTFGGVGEPARAISYRARVAAHASEAEIRALVEHTDTVAEVQNTLRRGMAVPLEAIEVESLTAR